MINELADTLKNSFNKDTLALEIPHAFEHFKGRDTKLELVLSNTIQPLKLHYAHNIVTKKIAYIFVNTKYQDIIYQNVDERLEFCIELFRDLLGFHIMSFEDLPKT